MEKLAEAAAAAGLKPEPAAAQPAPATAGPASPAQTASAAVQAEELLDQHPDPHLQSSTRTSCKFLRLKHLA